MKKGAMLAFLCLGMAGCDDEKAPLPAYVEALGELRTDADGRAATFVPDGGDTCTVTNAWTVGTPDSLYRILALYTTEGTSVAIRQWVRVLSPPAYVYPTSVVKTDPLQLVALWRGGRYLNVQAALSTGGGTHYFGFVDEGCTTDAEGRKTLRLRLLHDQNGDASYYTRTVYLSCSLAPYAARLTAGRDSVRFTLHTFDGEQTTTLAY